MKEVTLVLLASYSWENGSRSFPTFSAATLLLSPFFVPIRERLRTLLLNHAAILLDSI